MTMYRDIYQDLPSRVNAVWQRAKEAPKKENTDLRVTAMLMAAAAGFAMPFENLRYERAGNKSNWDDHPAFHGRRQAQYKTSLKACNEFLKKPISECPGLAGASLLQCKELRDIRDAAGSGKGHATVNTEKHDMRFPLAFCEMPWHITTLSMCRMVRTRLRSSRSFQKTIGVTVVAGKTGGTCS